VLYSFKGGADGANPAAGVIRDPTGNLYGTTYSGGAGGAGTVYRLDTNGNETVLHSFPLPVDGVFAVAGVIRDSAGNLCGTAQVGGPSNVGVVYRLDAAGHEAVLHGFTGGADGGQPFAGVIRDLAGNLYGTTYDGGTSGSGVVYKLDAAGQEAVLYTFKGGADGGHPCAAVVADAVGNLHGTTYHGGTAGLGVVYKLDVL